MASAQILHYRANKDQYVERNKRKRASLGRFLQGVKSYPCEDCGKSYGSWVMDLDHRPGEPKTSGVAALVNTSNSWPRVVQEIMKCDLVCANCHRERTHERLVAQALGSLDEVA